jgi:hypothetical protein
MNYIARARQDRMQQKFHFLSSVQEATLLGSIIVRSEKVATWQSQDGARRRSTACFSTQRLTPRHHRPQIKMRVLSLWYGFLHDKPREILSKPNGWVEHGTIFQNREAAS